MVTHMAQSTGSWTLDDLDRLPDDGNKYELVDGELFVTPAPSPSHESLALELRDRLVPYVKAQRLGRVYTPRSVVRVRGSEVEPDLMVRPDSPSPPQNWDQAPTPPLVVEILSPTTRRRDHEQKRRFYRRTGVAEYWIVDGEARTICIVTANADLVTGDELVWRPRGATEPFVLDVPQYFRDALGELP